MRIIAGRFKGRKLQRPPESITRPTTDRVRESVFNILQHLDGFDFEGSHVLDVFAGSGAMGLEALSRNAEQAIFIDKNPVACQIINLNIHHLKVEDKGSILSWDVLNLPRANRAMDLIFIDPPYFKGLEFKSFTHLMEKGWVKQGTIIVLETGKKTILEFPRGEFLLLSSRTFSNTTVFIFRKI